MEIKGYTYGYQANRGSYRTKAAINSQDLLFDVGINYVCLAFPIMQDTFNSTEIRFDYRNSITEKDIQFAIERAHRRGIKVCLKPMINCGDGIWRALINFPDEDMFGKDVYWDKWFESYTAFLLHYAELAEDTGCEMFCIGCEMLGTERKVNHWRSLIKKIRKVYQGPLVYNTNHGKEAKVPWFDALDYIGTSAYYPVASNSCDSKEHMVSVWETVRDQVKQVSKALNKKIIFMEIGCRSAKGCAKIPWDFTHKEYERNEEEQADFYDSCLQVFGEEEWFAGMFWWDWSTEIYDTKESAASDKGFNIHLKKAEEVVKAWYQKL